MDRDLAIRNTHPTVVTVNAVAKIKRDMPKENK